MERKRQKLLGRNKGSLTEQQTKGTVITTILIRRIYKTNGKMHKVALTAQCRVRSQAATTSAPQPAPLLRTQHEGTWCQIPCFVWPVWVSLSDCVPSWLLVKINPVLAKPRRVTIFKVHLKIKCTLQSFI